MIFDADLRELLAAAHALDARLDRLGVPSPTPSAFPALPQRVARRY